MHYFNNNISLVSDEMKERAVGCYISQWQQQHNDNNNNSNNHTYLLWDGMGTSQPNSQYTMDV